jgi:hypothetical protein
MNGQLKIDNGQRRSGSVWASWWDRSVDSVALRDRGWSNGQLKIDNGQ